MGFHILRDQFLGFLNPSLSFGLQTFYLMKLLKALCTFEDFWKKNLRPSPLSTQNVESPLVAIHTQFHYTFTRRLLNEYTSQTEKFQIVC